MISIVIPVVHGKYLDMVFKSIVNQSYSDYEVIVINDRSDHIISDIIKSYGFKELKYKGSLIEARYIGALSAKGNYILQLDETRQLTKNYALDKLNSINADVIFIYETEIITNYLSKAAAIDKRISFNDRNIDEKMPFVLPRYYKKEIIIESHKNLIRKLEDSYSKILAPEDLLVYTEARQLIKKVGKIDEALIAHHGDKRALQIAKKYFRYGRSTALLRHTVYSELSQPSLYERYWVKLSNVNSFLEFAYLFPLWGIRGFSFLMGLRSLKKNV